MAEHGSGEVERLGFWLSPDAALVLSNRIILAASQMVQPVFGWTAAELVGKSIRMLYPGQTDYSLIGEKARLAMAENPAYRDERFMLRKDGQVVWMEAHGHTRDPHDPEKLAVWTYRAANAQPSQNKAALTAAEKRISGYLVNGFTSKEIAQTLGCSPRTVEVHRANMIRKMKVRNSFDLVARLLMANEPS